MSDPLWDQFGGLRDGQAAINLCMIQMCLPDLAAMPGREKQILAALDVLNGQYDRNRVAHHCVIDPGIGSPCCSCLGEAKEKIEKAITRLLVAARPPIPCTTRWLTTLLNTGWWALGCVVHSLFPRAFLVAFPGRREPQPGPAAPPAAPAAAAGPADNDDEDPNESFQVKLGKRLARGRRMMSDPSFDLNLAFSMTALLPMHHSMAFLFAASKIDAQQKHDSITKLVASLDTCMTQHIELMEDNVFDPAGQWFILGFTRARQDAFADAARRHDTRKDMLRICGGFIMRVVFPMSEADVQLFLALETEDAEIVQVAQAYCQARQCCTHRSTQAYYTWLRAASLDQLAMVKQSWCPSTLHTERDHAGNTRNTRAKQGKTRHWRRQVSNYIVRLAKARWARNHKERQASLRRRAGTTYSQFKARMDAASERRRSPLSLL